MTITKHTATVRLTKQYVSMDNRAQKTGLEKRASCVIPNVWCVGTSSDWMWVLFTICCDCYASGATQGLFWGSPLCCWISLEPMYAQCDKHVHFRQTCIQPRKCVFPIQFSLSEKPKKVNNILKSSSFFKCQLMVYTYTTRVKLVLSRKTRWVVSELTQW